MDAVPSIKPEWTWWQKTLAGAATMAVTTVCSFIGSHWGGVTNDQLTDALGKQERKLGTRIDTLAGAVAKNSDDTKKYIDDSIAASRPPVVKRAKKRQEMQ
jgi:hypothetical protein